MFRWPVFLYGTWTGEKLCNLQHFNMIRSCSKIVAIEHKACSYSTKVVIIPTIQPRCFHLNPVTTFATNWLLSFLLSISTLKDYKFIQNARFTRIFKSSYLYLHVCIICNSFYDCLSFNLSTFLWMSFHNGNLDWLQPNYVYSTAPNRSDPDQSVTAHQYCVTLWRFVARQWMGNFFGNGFAMCLCIVL